MRQGMDESSGSSCRLRRARLDFREASAACGRGRMEVWEGPAALPKPFINLSTEATYRISGRFAPAGDNPRQFCGGTKILTTVQRPGINAVIFSGNHRRASFTSLSQETHHALS